ncbi:uncharacterized protein LAESUDRAFT_112945 [Laetiporus sulphureus 93-53]|uniref:Uncharacterized protein n=1 Tax=Laetiporus sulphureus 93-53 TaxID=1314785 RepID=A0A165EPR6_9APHY|nr:uncharacterized protein LAESUDRAFT_112945 [Laetiporus sulphureus 93-53]KZT07507.1 hypothetical protein LAESUDRAFT_112945 [Laetiporus sulphureus 93-53]
MNFNKVYVIQFWRSANFDPKIPLHWEVAIETSPKVGERRFGRVFNIVGFPGNFAFEMLDNVEFTKPPPFAGLMTVGIIKSNDIDKMTNVIQKVDIVEDDHWNCQNWTHAVLRKCKAEGLGIFYEGSFKHLQSMMRESWNRWDLGNEEPYDPRNETSSS